MPLCRLCQNDRVLRNSHIVPEFLYERLYNDKGHMMSIHGLGHRGWQAVQKGLREPLFCESCEQYFNEYYEKPFYAEWVASFPLPDPWNVEDVHWISVTYSSFKLFHLSVLFRAGVSTLPTYAEVSLGPHQEKLRQLLLNRDPGKQWQYPVLGHAVIHHRTKQIIYMVSRAQQSSHSGHRCYGMMYGGAQWWVAVSSHQNQELQRISLRPDGRMPFHAVHWNELSVLQRASEALRNAAPNKRFLVPR